MTAIYFALQQDYTFSAVALLFCALLDTFDGAVARKLSLESDFGAELDSLADMAAFAVAPFAVLVTYYDSTLLTVCAGLIPLVGAYRLARHNINAKALRGYVLGLPIGASAVLTALLIFTNQSTGMACIGVGLLLLGYCLRIPVKKRL